MNSHKLSTAQVDALVFMLHHYKADNLLATLQIALKFINCLPDSTPEKQVYVNDIHGLERIVHLLANGDKAEAELSNAAES